MEITIITAIPIKELKNAAIAESSILIVDEFTLLSTEQLLRLSDVVEQQNTFLIPVGDPLQIGNPLPRKIMEMYQQTALTFPDRQQNPLHREGISKIAGGDIKGGLLYFQQAICFGRKLDDWRSTEPLYPLDYVPMLEPDLIITNNADLIAPFKQKLGENSSAELSTIDTIQGVSKDVVRVCITKDKPMTQQSLLVAISRHKAFDGIQIITDCKNLDELTTLCNHDGNALEATLQFCSLQGRLL